VVQADPDVDFIAPGSTSARQRPASESAKRRFCSPLSPMHDGYARPPPRLAALELEFPVNRRRASPRSTIRLQHRHGFAPGGRTSDGTSK